MSLNFVYISRLKGNKYKSYSFSGSFPGQIYAYVICSCTHKG